MLRGLTHRLLPIFQLTRMALVFTAIADGQTALLIAAQHAAGEGGDIGRYISARTVIAALMASVGLYGFGMSLNDIIDRRRDSLIAAHRPIPSGRIRVVTAHVICGALAALAILGGFLYSNGTRNGASLALVLWTMGLVVFYDLAGKYLVAPGLITLGLIRFFHALIPAPGVPLLWHPLLLLDHVALLSAFAYHWEEKRPPLTRAHWTLVGGWLACINAAAIGLVYMRRGWAELWVRPGLLIPLAAAAGFVFVAWRLRKMNLPSREAGQRLMLYGLLWLILYDAAFVAAYTRHWVAALSVLLLLPVAYGAVQFMRWWSKLVAVSQTPSFKRVRL